MYKVLHKTNFTKQILSVIISLYIYCPWYETLSLTLINIYGKTNNINIIVLNVRVNITC